MRHILLALLLAYGPPAFAGLFGPGKFEISEVDTRFSSPPQEAWMSQNNRVSSRSVVGGKYLDANGVYLNPTVARDKATGMVSTLALMLVNKCTLDTLYGSPNCLGIPKAVEFLIDGAPLSLPVVGGDQKIQETTSYNTVSRSASKNVTETGLVELTKGQYEAILAAKELVVRVVGATRSVTYEQKDLAPAFVGNLASFYEQKVK